MRHRPPPTPPSARPRSRPAPSSRAAAFARRADPSARSAPSLGRAALAAHEASPPSAKGGTASSTDRPSIKAGARCVAFAHPVANLQPSLIARVDRSRQKARRQTSDFASEFADTRNRLGRPRCRRTISLQDRSGGHQSQHRRPRRSHGLLIRANHCAASGRMTAGTWPQGDRTGFVQHEPIARASATFVRHKCVRRRNVIGGRPRAHVMR